MKDSKQRLFEVMGKLDSSFKPKMNEGGINYGDVDYDDSGSVEKPSNQHYTPELDGQNNTNDLNDFEAILQQYGFKKDETEPVKDFDSTWILMASIYKFVVLLSPTSQIVILNSKSGDRIHGFGSSSNLEQFKKLLQQKLNATHYGANSVKNGFFPNKGGNEEGLGEAFEPDYSNAEYFEDKLEGVLREMLESNLGWVYTDDSIMEKVEKILQKLRMYIKPQGPEGLEQQ